MIDKNNSIVISVSPEQCEFIISGKKTIMLSQTCPELKPPFKCYIYCNKDGLQIYGDNKTYITDDLNILNKPAQKAFEETSKLFKFNGKIIGEFICDKIYHIDADSSEVILQNDIRYLHKNLLKSPLCMTIEDFKSFCKGIRPYGLHISNFMIYDKPKELCEFKASQCDYLNENYCSAAIYSCSNQLIDTNPDGSVNMCLCGNGIETLINPPQSWCYVR